ncbi:ABC transporter substrate-binding protein [Microbacterium sp. NPDC091313]
MNRAELALAAHQDVPMSSDEVFDLFAGGGGDSWLFAATFDRLAVGRAVSLLLPEQLTGLSERAHLLGVFSRIDAGRRIVVEHTLPWRGRLVITLTPTGPGSTRVRVSEHFDESGFRWMMRARGWPVIEPARAPAHRIGLLTSRSGTVSMFMAGCENLAELAVEELNLDGGLHALPFELLTGDDASTPDVGVLEARRLRRLGCRVIIASVSSATYRALQTALADEDVLLIQPIMNEGGVGRTGTSFRLGERPRGQVRRALETIPGALRAPWFLIGNSYAWSEGAHVAARAELERASGRVTGERLMPLGTGDFSAALEQIRRSGARFVLSSLVGHDEVAFERALWASGLRPAVTTLSLTADDVTAAHIGREAAEGLWAVSGYFAGIGTAHDGMLRAHDRERHGPWAPAITTYSESTYSAVQLYARALAKAGADATVRDVADALSSMGFDAPRGSIRVNGAEHLDGPLHVVRSHAGAWQAQAS